ncbi:MAG: ISAs1 family transposase [Limisphaerales bacterium]
MNPTPVKSASPTKPLPEELSVLLRTVQVHQLDTPELRERAQGLLAAHHYLGAVQAVGEQLHYAVSDAQGEWVAVVIFAAAALHLRPREQWIGWSDEQRRRRLALVANNVRFLLLPGRTVPNLGSAVLSRVLARLSDDWQARYAHPVLVVETFVDPERFKGTVYRASGWSEVGQTQGHGRQSRDYYENHDRPKRLFVRELVKNARRSLQAEHLKPALAAVEAKVPVRSTLKAAALQSLAEHFRAVPDYRRRMGQYPLFALLGIAACAYLAGAPRGQKDLAAFSRRLSSRQRAALGVRRTASGEYPAPSQPTFCRLFARVSEQAIEQALLAHQAQVRGAPPKDELVVLDGKVPGHSGGLNVVSAITAPSLHYLGSEVVADKTNEIPAVRTLCQRLALAGRLVSIDALHTQSATARQLVLEHGGDYVMTVKANQPALQAVVQAQVPDPGAPLLPP